MGCEDARRALKAGELWVGEQVRGGAPSGTRIRLKLRKNGTYSRLILLRMGCNLVPFFAFWDEITSRFEWFSGRDYVPFGGKWDGNASRFWKFDLFH